MANDELFIIRYSATKNGRGSKFSLKEKAIIEDAAKKTADYLSKVCEFSIGGAKGAIYSIPIIFEKVSIKTFNEKHFNHYAMTDWPPIGYKWNGIEIKSRTAIISICPHQIDELSKTISHEMVHAFVDSFLSPTGVNHANNDYFVEGFCEFISQLVDRATAAPEKK